MKTYKQGQIDIFNRIWDASIGKTKDYEYEKGLLLLMKELNKIREELFQGKEE